MSEEDEKRGFELRERIETLLRVLATVEDPHDVLYFVERLAERMREELWHGVHEDDET